MAAAKKQRKRPRRVRPRHKQWSLATYLQWLPVISVAITGIVVSTRVLDRLDVLEKAQPSTSIAEELTNVRDRMEGEEKDLARIEKNEAADMVELKAVNVQLWQAIARRQGVTTP